MRGETGLGHLVIRYGDDGMKPWTPGDVGKGSVEQTLLLAFKSSADVLHN